MKEKKGLGEIGRREERREGRVKRRIIKGIVMVMVMIVMGCNSGGVKEGEEGKNKFLQSLVNVSNEFLNVFTSFGEMVGSVLGLNLDSKKSDVGKYFKTVQETVQGIKDKLEKIVGDMKKENNPNAEATATAVKTLVESKLDKIIAGAKEASEAIGDASELIGNVADQNGAGVAGTDVDKLVEGIKGIVKVVLEGVGSADAGDDKKASDGSSSRNAAAGEGEAGKLFAAGAGAAGDQANAKKVATDASKAVGGVRGADILQAMIKSEGVAIKFAKNNDGNAGSAPKDAEVAGGIALRAMAKGGKFANGAANSDVSAAVKGAATSAVTKALDTLTIGIRRAIDLGLKSVKEAMKTNTGATAIASDKSGSSSQNQ
ncbi:Variable outer membrane protein (plasmid) [Borrelia crocidurae DOU]|uniref:Variable large protein n=1 Tax=Borrelia crocidurae DOU TaxID=1293575 RepID=W5SQ32_9SPIR|nr:variable large family protein [Borrelia crocidurae]AHH07206.1 Variable outer membrane protein [Borrelia crocidurae DOU]